MRVISFSLNPEANAFHQWDTGLLLDVLNIDILEVEDSNSLPICPEAIVVIPARHHLGLEEAVNAELAKIDKVKLYLIGDEEAQFDVSKISHSNIEITVQNPRPDKHSGYKKLGTGYPKHFLDSIPADMPKKDLAFFFAGQSTYHAPELKPPMNVNHRRRLMAEQIEGRKDGILVRSVGFTQGLEPTEYYKNMARAKVAPCPSGPELPDTFRLYEALELGCVPIADEITQKVNGGEDFPDYWSWFFDEKPPFPVIRDYSELNKVIDESVAQYPDLNNKCQAWWYQEKWKLRDEVDLDQLLTVVIPVSPIKSHPSTKILDETIESIRFHLPNVKIIISFDGVREEQADLGSNYREHIRAVLYKYRDIYPMIFGEHKHQSGMMKALLDNHITTPLVMYVEQDTPLEKEYIAWGEIYHMIESGESNLVRFHHESSIPTEHNHMMLNKKGDFTQTVQWSQRPHIASTAFYRRIMSEFSEKSNCFLEDHLHGVVWNSFVKDGKLAYNQWLLHIYTPEGNIRRSYHTDGREGAEKYDTSQTF